MKAGSSTSEKGTTVSAHIPETKFIWVTIGVKSARVVYGLAPSLPALESRETGDFDELAGV